MKLNYRPEIDGLRAIAVLAVIFYHSQVSILGHQPFKGGFIGVDIFFVISGYLITSIILIELIRTDSFSFKYFYERRIRRLLPALITVMLFTLPFAWIYLFPINFVDFSKSILFSLGFSSNLYFHFSGQEYGAQSGLLKPFLHTWSLSVEEQFYILFPIILMFSFKYFKKYIFFIFFFGFVISLILADWSSKHSQSIAFYFIHTRMWELLSGSMLAYIEVSRGYRCKNKTLNLILPSVGFLLIILSIIFFKLYFPHPSFHTLPAVLGVCLIIWFSDNSEPITKILSTKLFVGIGLISYSLYLWHYPVFAFNKITQFTQGNIFKSFLLFFFIFVMSYFSYKFIEKPFRNKKNKFSIITVTLTLCILILLIFNFYIIKEKGIRHNLDINIQSKLTFEYLEKNNRICFNNIDICKFNPNKKQKVFLIGDSHLASLSYNLKSRLNDYNFISITSEGYFYFNDKNIIQIDANSKKINLDFIKFNEIVEEELSKSQNNIIIFGGSTSLYFYKKRYLDKSPSWGIEYVEKNNLKRNARVLEEIFYNQLKKITKNNIVILVYPIPEIGDDIFLNIKNLNSSEYKYSDYRIINSEIINFFDNIKMSNLIKIKPTERLCNIKNNLCPVVDKDNNELIFSDPWHPSLRGAEMINNLIINEIKKSQEYSF